MKHLDTAEQIIKNKFVLLRKCLWLAFANRKVGKKQILVSEKKNLKAENNS